AGWKIRQRTPGGFIGRPRAGGKALLEKGVDVHEQGGDYGNALQAASIGGHK
ncbi:uncharacterized protein BDR25DRAFT_381482, partial [Lindgomyces ingoldianus]